MDIGDKFVFPRTLPNLLDHLADNSHLFTLDLRNETTTEYCMISPAFSLDSEQHKAAVEQQKFLSNEWAWSLTTKKKITHHYCRENMSRYLCVKVPISDLKEINKRKNSNMQKYKILIY